MPPTLNSQQRSGDGSILRAYDAVVDSVDAEDHSLVGRINTSGVDRYKTVIDPKGGKLDAYRRNPVVLWEHGKDPRRFTDPIGRNLWVRSSGGQQPRELLAKTRFLDDDFSRQRWEWYRDGVLSAFSVNILPDEAGPPTKEELRSRPDWEPASMIYRTWELAEYSGTAVPGNADTLVADRAAKMLDLVERSLLWLPDEVRPIIEAKAREFTDSSAGPAVVPRYITHSGNKWIVHAEDGKVLGEHDSEEGAKKQLAAVEAHKHDKGRSAPYVDGATVHNADGSVLAVFADEATARHCLEAMQTPRSWRAIHDAMAAESSTRNTAIAAEVQAMIDLMINGRV